RPSYRRRRRGIQATGQGRVRPRCRRVDHVADPAEDGQIDGDDDPGPAAAHASAQLAGEDGICWTVPSSHAATSVGGMVANSGWPPGVPRRTNTAPRATLDTGTATFVTGMLMVAGGPKNAGAV